MGERSDEGLRGWDRGWSRMVVWYLERVSSYILFEIVRDTERGGGGVSTYVVGMRVGPVSVTTQ